MLSSAGLSRAQLQARGSLISLSTWPTRFLSTQPGGCMRSTNFCSRCCLPWRLTSRGTESSMKSFSPLLKVSIRLESIARGCRCTNYGEGRVCVLVVSLHLIEDCTYERYFICSFIARNFLKFYLLYIYIVLGLALRIPWIEEPGRLQSGGCKESDMTEWLHFHSVALHGLSLVAGSRVYSLLWCEGFWLWQPLLFRRTGSRCSGFSSCSV